MGACLSDDVLAAFVSGEASADELREIEDHLAECATCTHLCRAVAAEAPAKTPTLIDGEQLRWSLPEIPRGATVGRFLVIELVGWGGMGVVYAAYDPQLDRKVALKFLAPSIDPARLSREARTVARLAHPNVVAVHDVGEHDGAPYVAMELVVGETLDRWLAREPRTFGAILPVFLQAGDGLAAAHASGIVHRDFKPSNVLIGADGRARVSDFGLARIADQSAERDDEHARRTSDPAITGTGAMVGTPAYMAPEQRTGAAVDARADQYSFALALEEALASGAAALPDALRTALQRARSTAPADRFPTMVELLEALRAHDPGDPRNVGQAALAAADRMTQRWRRALWVMGAVTLAAISAAAIVTTIIARRERDAARRAEHLANERLEAEQRLAARVSYERGDLTSSLEVAGELLARGVDDRLLRQIVGTVSWAWSHESPPRRDVRSAIPATGGRRALLELDDHLEVIDETGETIARLATPPDSFGFDLDERGENVVVLDPDLRVIPVAHPERARTIAKVAAGQRWILPKFVGDHAFAVRADDDVLVLDDTGTIAARFSTRTARPIRLGASRRLVLADEASTEVVSLATGERHHRDTKTFAVAERARDQLLALAEPGRVSLVDPDLRTLRTFEIAGDARALQFSPAGDLLAISLDDDLVIYEVATGRRRARIASHRDTAFLLEDDAVWTGANGVLRRFGLAGALHASVVVSGRGIDAIWRAGPRLAVLAADTLQMYALPLTQAREMPDPCEATRAVPTGSGDVLVACTDKSLRRWSAAGSAVASRDVDTPAWLYVAPDGAYAAVLRYTSVEVLVGEARHSAPLAIESVRAVAATPHGLLVATVSGLRRLAIPEMTWTELPGPALPVTALAWRGGTRDTVLAVVENASLVEIGATAGAPRALPEPVVDVAVSADGRTIAVRDPKDRVAVLSIDTLRARSAAPISVGEIRAFALDRTGARLAITTADSRVLLVTTSDGSALELPFGRVPAGDVGFTPDGQALVVVLAGVPTRMALPDDDRPIAELATAVRARYSR